MGNLFANAMDSVVLERSIKVEESTSRELEVNHDTLISEDGEGFLQDIFSQFHKQKIIQWFNGKKRIRRYSENNPETGIEDIVWQVETKLRKKEKIKGEAIEASESSRKLHSRSEVTAAYDGLDPEGVIKKTRYDMEFLNFLEVIEAENIPGLIQKFGKLIAQVHVDIVEHPTPSRDGYRLVRLELEYHENVEDITAESVSSREIFDQFIQFLLLNEVGVAEAQAGQKKLARAAKQNGGIAITPDNFDDWQSAEVEKAA